MLHSIVILEAELSRKIELADKLTNAEKLDEFKKTLLEEIDDIIGAINLLNKHDGK